MDIEWVRDIVSDIPVSHEGTHEGHNGEFPYISKLDADSLFANMKKWHSMLRNRK